MKAVAYFIRHGDTDANDQDVFRGDVDFSLNEDGKQQAQDLVKFFRGRKFSKAFTSTRTRSKQTIEPLMKSRGMTAASSDRLDSLNTGVFAGLPKNDTNLEILKHYQEHPKETIPGGEKVRTFRNDVDAELMSLIRMGEESNDPVVACTHGSVLKELSRIITGDMKSVRVDPGGVIGVYRDHEGYTLIALLNPIDGAEEDKPGS